MLPRINRLCKQKEIEGVMARGKTARDGCLTIKVKKNALDAVRFCFIVSRRVSRKAVGRNKAKRRMREISRSALMRFKKGNDIIIIASPCLGGKNFQEIKESMERLFIRSGIFSGGGE
jgi:ribonuclease P protein component